MTDVARVADTIRKVVQEAPARRGAGIAEAVRAVPAADIGGFLHATFDAGTDRELLTTALGASPGAASGIVVLTADAAIDAADAGKSVILVRNETSPDDVLGMQSSRGILTTRGGITSHAAVVARGWGIPAVVGAGELVIDDDGIHLGDRLIPPGTEISIDGRTGEVFLGAADTTTAEAPPELTTLLRWADLVRHAADAPVSVRANADNAADAAHARHLGAEGIGLCRTEHMFLADDRLPLVRRLILSDDPATETEALHDLEIAQKSDFEGILISMDGLPVTVRLLDPPLHEFLPDLERLVVAEALDELDDEGRRELAAVRRLHEVNPMIGTRGVRLGIVRPGVYQMQVRALALAMAAVTAAGRHPIVEVMIPLVVDPGEMRLAREWVAEALADVGSDVTVSVGAMLETPRAALVAGELAEVSDFFSFGTNDLTQLVFAFSRDDVGSRLIPAYLEAGLLEHDPFDSLDQIGVGRIIRHACTHARGTKPAIKIGVCGEQAGDPRSAGFLVESGVDYVSCSPYRVPIARLAVAQALLSTGRLTDAALEAIAVAECGAAMAAAAAPPVEHHAEHEAPIEPAPDDVDFLVLHALRIKGFAGSDVVAEIAFLDVSIVDGLLPSMADAELVRHIAARNLWQLLPAGKERHAELLGTVPGADIDGLRSHYERFLDLNVAFKECCSRWQVRNGEPNEHNDEAYDDERIEELRSLHHAASPVLAGFATAIPRFEGYQRRLAAALTRLLSGETKMYTGVMCGSYHDVWMELHEDLVQLLGVDRHAEGSY